MIHVKLASKAYDVVIASGVRHQVGERLATIWQPRQVMIVTDQNVGPLYLADVSASLAQHGFTVHTTTVPAGETSKSLQMVEQIVGEMAACGFTRQDAIVALGGGVVGDLTGVIASLYMRGIAFAQIATSLTAQVDASVGGKTAVNMATVKNIMGSFYQPDMVLIDPDFLQTLSDRDLVEGYAEVVKTSVLAGGDFWRLTGDIKTVAAIRERAETLITKSVLYKRDIVVADEKEGGVRKYLNFGHTLGHAIELMAHGELRHGEAVAIGMVAISERFEKAGITESGITALLRDRLVAVGLPVTSPLIGQVAFYDHLKNDKKNAAGTLQLVAISVPGQPTIVQKDLADMPAFVESR